ncbi:putative ankyrin repeat protein RF_0381 [Haliotis cracherodii]|uniref:putative ankyrin repeat protein RF_0381 n=1 Tax=Haliotis cracherodii TaxID=6455 RepID=UPI0039E738B3
MVAARFAHLELVDFLVKKGGDMSLVNKGGDNILHQACRGGDEKTVKRVLEQDKLNINSRGKNGDTPVMIAARAGYRELVDFLVKKGADMTLVNNDGDNILHQACRGGDIEKVRGFLEQDKLEINSRGKNGETPVMMAARAGYVELVDFLVKKGADMSLVDSGGDNILHHVCRGGDIEIVKSVLAQDKLDINSRGKNGETPVMVVAAWARLGELLDFLVKKGADMSVVNNDGDNILHQACRGGDIETVRRVLAQDKLDINSRGKNGDTPAMVAAWTGHGELVDFLVKKGADMSLVNYGGDNILHQSCKGGDVETVKRVLEQDKLGINSRSKNGSTPVMMAAKAGREGLVTFLVKIGADMSLVNNGGDNILHQACRGGDIETVRRVLEKENVFINSRDKTGQTSVMMAAMAGHGGLVTFLVKEGADMSLANEGGDNILHQTCRGGDVETVRSVLEQDKLDINCRGKNEETPVMMAAMAGHGELVDFLMKKGADMSLVNNVGDNILHQACRGGDIDTVRRVLAQDKLDINSKGWRGKTPLMAAAESNRNRLLNFLISNGANLSLVNENDDNILHIACYNKAENLVEHILAPDMVDINARNKDGKTAAMIAEDNGFSSGYKVLVARGCQVNEVTATIEKSPNKEQDCKITISGDDNTNAASEVGQQNAVSDDHKKKTVRKRVNKKIIKQDRHKKATTPSEEAHANMGHLAAGTVAPKKENQRIQGPPQRGRKRRVPGRVKVGAVKRTQQNAITSQALPVSEDVKDVSTKRTEENTIKSQALPVSRDVKDGSKDRTPRRTRMYRFLPQTLGALHFKARLVTDLEYACKVGDVYAARHFLSLGQDINERGHRQRTPVMWAAVEGHKEVFDLLVSKGANLRQKSDEGNNILHLACTGNVEIVRYILSQNIVDINSRGSDGMTPVLWAALKGKAKVEVVGFLVDKADVSLIDDKGNTILHLAADARAEELIEYILSHDMVDINARNNAGRTAAMTARRYGVNPVYELLVSRGCHMK